MRMKKGRWDGRPFFVARVRRTAQFAARICMLLSVPNIVSNKSRARIRVGATISIVFLAAGYSLSAFSGSGQVPSVPSQTSSPPQSTPQQSLSPTQATPALPVAPTAAAPQRTGLNIVVLDPATAGLIPARVEPEEFARARLFLNLPRRCAGLWKCRDFKSCKRAMTMKTPRSTTVLPRLMLSAEQFLFHFTFRLPAHREL